MKKILMVPVLGLPLLLAGCEADFQDDVDPQVREANQAMDEADIDSKTRTQMVAEERELKEELAKAQAKDPSIKDMYYSYNENGEKQVHIIREVKDEKTGESKMADTILPMMAGMMLGQMMANSMMMSAMAMNAANTSYHSNSQYRERRNMATSSYARTTRSNIGRSYVSSRPGSAYSARSAGAFNGASSARSSGYSAGG